MGKLIELAKQYPNIIISVSLSDLIECNEELIRKAKFELEQQIMDASTETYPSAKRVSEILEVDRSTLWRWAKCGYLVPIEVGGKRRYRMSDVKRILKE